MKIELESVGADPELFLTHEGEIQSAIGIIRGTKRRPAKTGIPGFTIQPDNILAEFNIPPAKSKDEFVSNIKTGVRIVKLSIPDGWNVAPIAAATVNPDLLKPAAARKFGCEPDYNVWTNEVQVADAPTSCLRTSSGHLHIGYKNPTEEISTKIAKALDIRLGAPSVILDPDRRRREVYGKAGSIRLKKYGLEYRTLSSFWLASEALTSWVYDEIPKALNMVSEGVIDNLAIADIYDIVTAINLYDTNLANSVMKKFDITCPKF